MELDLVGRRALVTASSGGIGAVVAARLAGEGCAVLVHGRDRVRAAEVASRLRAAGGEADVVLGDLTDERAAGEVAERAEARRSLRTGDFETGPDGRRGLGDRESAATPYGRT